MLLSAICCGQYCLTSCLAGFLTDCLVLLHHCSTIAAFLKASTSLSCSTSALSPLLPTSSLMSTCINVSSTANSPISIGSTGLLSQSLYIYLYLFFIFLVKMVDFYNYTIIIINYNFAFHLVTIEANDDYRRYIFKGNNCKYWVLFLIFCLCFLKGIE